ncbi:uncharacterized protein CC84DRAFT_44103 [Paraphaeosphaeria sporulosa]|uniref:Uncharacterized protein n=1 Tax=Paraphaeosphaeria sporulosa TaxID=1460663 RepID=A0A177CXE9_9PLEO|nr:uncharacterized protein CC84DRAFT_44103 [Paraphaeosphaeria sporulosa]OAG11718.1 hypothetical protein CC84DRAFT_44103 [Paraphaeosphaeria sporulosa]
MRPSHHHLPPQLLRRDVPLPLHPFHLPLPRLPAFPLHLLLQLVQLLHNLLALRSVRRRDELLFDEAQLNKRPTSAFHVQLWILTASARSVRWDGVEDSIEASGGGAPAVLATDVDEGRFGAEGADGRDDMGVRTRARGGEHRLLAWCRHKVSMSQDRVAYFFGAFACARHSGIGQSE